MNVILRINSINTADPQSSQSQISQIKFFPQVPDQCGRDPSSLVNIHKLLKKYEPFFYLLS